MKRPWIWFYKPELYWYGWMTLIPIMLGGDEWERPTLVLGWNFTGRAVIPIWRATVPCDQCGLVGDHKMQCSYRPDGGQVVLPVTRKPDGTLDAGWGDEDH